MKNTIKIISVLFCSLMLSCNLTGEEVARLDINAVSREDNLVMKESKISLNKGDKINFWSEMDVKYEGEV